MTVVEGAEHTGPIISGFHAWVFLWIWVPVVLIYGLWRSLYQPAPDTIRPAGPLPLEDGGPPAGA